MMPDDALPTDIRLICHNNNTDAQSLIRYDNARLSGNAPQSFIIAHDRRHTFAPLYTRTAQSHYCADQDVTTGDRRGNGWNGTDTVESGTGWEDGGGIDGLIGSPTGRRTALTIPTDIMARLTRTDGVTDGHHR